MGYKNSCWDSFPGWVHLPGVTVVIKYILDLLMAVAVPSHLLGHGSPTPPHVFCSSSVRTYHKEGLVDIVIGVNIVSRDSRSLDDKKRLLVCMHAYVCVWLNLHVCLSLCVNECVTEKGGPRDELLTNSLIKPQKSIHCKITTTRNAPGANFGGWAFHSFVIILDTRCH